MGVFSPLIWPLYKSGVIIPIWGIIFVGYGVVSVFIGIFNYYNLHNSIFLIIQGIVVLIVGIFLFKFGMKNLRDKKIGTSLSYSAPPQIYPCFTCGQPLRYVHERKLWYCNNCKKFV